MTDAHSYRRQDWPVSRTERPGSFAETGPGNAGQPAEPATLPRPEVTG